MVLLHAIYSSYEYVSASKLSSISLGNDIPYDIKAQIIIGLIIILLSSASSGFAKMDPIRVADMNFKDTVNGDNEYAYLETRPNFQDLISKRKAYLDWRKTQNIASDTK